MEPISHPQLPVRRVNVRKGQTVVLALGEGVNAPLVEMIRYPSGAVELRNLRSGSMLRQWAPKEV